MGRWLLTPNGGVYPSDSPALWKKVDIGNYDWDVVEYADGATENYDWKVPLSLWGSGGTLRLFWRTPTTSANGRWQAGNRPIANGEASDGTLTNDAATLASAGTTNNVNIGTITLTTTGWAIDELLHLRISRLGGDAADTLSAIAQLIFAVLEYTDA